MILHKKHPKITTYDTPAVSNPMSTNDLARSQSSYPPITPHIRYIITCVITWFKNMYPYAKRIGVQREALHCRSALLVSVLRRSTSYYSSNRAHENSTCTRGGRAYPHRWTKSVRHPATTLTCLARYARLGTCREARQLFSGGEA